MKFDISKLGSVTVLTPLSAISGAEVDDFAQFVDEHRRKSNGRLVLDLSQVSFLDSRGVEAVWDFADTQRENGRSAKIASVPELCREIFDLTGVIEHLDLFDVSESAVKSFL